MKFIVVGGGISGCLCSIFLARRGHFVTVIEKLNRPLKKMLATGNGRCNLTNLNMDSKFIMSENNFSDYAISKFNEIDFINFLKTIGLYTTIDNGTRVYPKSLKSTNVVNLILEEMNSLGVKIIVDSKVVKILKDKNFKIFTNDDIYESDVVIFAAGGASSPMFGTDGSSFKILKDLGHKVTKLSPSLTQVRLDSKYLKHLSGVKVVGKCELFLNNELIDSKYGEFLFTDYGISGPPILDLSRTVGKNNDGVLKLRVPIINKLDLDSILDDLYSFYYSMGYFSLEKFLLGFVDKKFIYYVCDLLNLEKDNALNSISENKFKKLVDVLINSEFLVVSTNGFKTSQVTCGGIDTNFVNNMTMESKIIDGLYIIGEALDVDGICGGYNIQWAASSAFLASIL